ncbi:hypothetical protein FG484_37065, partial [Burkholderia pseudomallei]|nr:hypothetical protein [Burkholderia pseudomallei]
MLLIARKARRASARARRPPPSGCPSDDHPGAPMKKISLTFAAALALAATLAHAQTGASAP